MKHTTTRISHRKRLEADGKVVNQLPAGTYPRPSRVFHDPAVPASTPKKKARKSKLELSAGISPSVAPPLEMEPLSILEAVTSALGWERGGLSKVWGSAPPVRYINSSKLEALANMEKEDVPRALVIAMEETTSYWGEPDPPTLSAIFLQKRLELGI